MSNIFATFAAAKGHMYLSSNTKSGAKVQQKNEKYKLFGEKTSIILGFILRTAFLRYHSSEGKSLCWWIWPCGRMVVASL